MPKTKNFDEHETLEKITSTFWRLGYADTSLSDLMLSTGLNKTSLYATYGNKEQMFVKALDQYSQKTLPLKHKPSDGLKFIKSFFRMLIDDAISGKAQNGCFVMNSKLEMGLDKHDPKYKSVQGCWDKLQKSLETAVETAKKNSDFKPRTNTTKVSKWLLSQAFLIRQLSKFNKDPEQFKEILKQIDQVIENNQNKETV